MNILKEPSIICTLWRIWMNCGAAMSQRAHSFCPAVRITQKCQRGSNAHSSFSAIRSLKGAQRREFWGATWKVRVKSWTIQTNVRWRLNLDFSESWIWIFKVFHVMDPCNPCNASLTFTTAHHYYPTSKSSNILSYPFNENSHEKNSRIKNWSINYRTKKT